MRFLLNGRFLARPMTGVDRSALNLARGLAAMFAENSIDDHQLDVAVPNGAPHDAEIRKQLSLPEDSRIHRSRAKGYFWEQVILARLERDATLLSLCNMGPVTRENQLVLIHDAQVFDEPESYSIAFRTAYRVLLPRLARRAKGVMTVSEYSSKRLIANGVVKDRSIGIVPNAGAHLCRVESDDAVLERYGLQRGGYLLALGGSARHKNLPMLVDACRARTQAELPLVIAGESGCLPAERDATKGFIGLGRVSDGELRALYENACIFLFPSLTEGFGLPALEAMQLGCPVIASRAGAIPEVVGDAAILCEASDESMWTAVIESVQSDELVRLKLCEEGRKQAAKFDWQRSSGILLSIAGSTA